jgi:uncharacterized membrane protein (UPF0127 family)
MRPRRASQARPRFAPAAALLAVALILVACEHRIEEPVPPRGAGAGDRAAQGPSEAPTAAGAGDAARRCIKPTPATPARALAGAGPGPDPACPPDPTGPPALRSGKVIFIEAKAPDVMVDIAERDKERSRGLMFRKSMPENQGMIFAFQDRVNHTFWMHNTCIPLDMLFIDNDGMIVGIEENTPTMNDATFEVGCPSTYVLELNAGWARRHGVVAGQRVKLDGI